MSYARILVSWPFFWRHLSNTYIRCSGTHDTAEFSVILLLLGMMSIAQYITYTQFNSIYSKGINSLPGVQRYHIYNIWRKYTTYGGKVYNITYYIIFDCVFRMHETQMHPILHNKGLYSVCISCTYSHQVYIRNIFGCIC